MGDGLGVGLCGGRGCVLTRASRGEVLQSSGGPPVGVPVEATSGPGDHIRQKNQKIYLSNFLYLFL